jgi:ATP-dependent 26S proteasome regulatory subunit
VLDDARVAAAINSRRISALAVLRLGRFDRSTELERGRVQSLLFDVVLLETATLGKDHRWSLCGVR